MRHLTRLQYFAAIAEAGTITAAADRLNITKAVVSKQLQLLEAELGTALVIRNSRHLKLTERGAALYESAKAALTQIEEAYRLAQQGNEMPTGTLRVTAPLDFGISYVAEASAIFSRRYPQVSIDLNFADARLDPVEHRFDIAFRVGWLRDSTNIARKLADFQQFVVAAPALLEESGYPSVPGDLRKLPFIANSALDGSQQQWSFRQTGQSEQNISLVATTTANTAMGIRASVMAAGGFAILPDFLVSDALETGRLVRLLPDFALRSGGIYAVFPPTQYRSAAVREFLKIVEQLLRTPLQNGAPKS